mmetsp:Transcript_22827/g.63677  ORF Transcript_22827/g.63677 Transcript_22827/m.63677 type:complete len:85 (+) Transcript_22827:776-1030(+)
MSRAQERERERESGTAHFWNCMCIHGRAVFYFCKNSLRIQDPQKRRANELHPALLTGGGTPAHPRTISTNTTSQNDRIINNIIF